MASLAPVHKQSGARPYVIAALVLLFLLILGFLGYRWASKGGLATLTEMRGAPERDYAARMEEWRSAAVGDGFDSGDGARTGQDETAIFRLYTGAQLTLKPASQIRFQKGPGGDKGMLGIHVDVGEAEVQTTQAALTIDSQFGPIVIDANSAVSMRRTGEQLAVMVEVGSVQLGNSNTRVAAGETWEVELGGLVLEPKAGPTEEPTPEATELAQEPEQTPLNRGNGVDRADLVVAAGKSFTIHDPNPPTAVGISVAHLCDGGPARLSIDEQSTEARGQANLVVGPGRHKYEVRCLDKPDELAAQGSVTVLQDTGTKSLPAFSPSASVSTDGRQYTVLYQYRLPQVTVSWPNAPQAASYTLNVDGRSITTKQPSYVFSSLQAGTHKLSFAAASTPPRASRVTTVTVTYDSQAPAARVAIPPGGYQAGSSVQVAGQALPGWTVSVDGKELEVDSQRRFSEEMTPTDSLPIEFSHPTHGTHYYLRRSTASSP